MKYDWSDLLSVTLIKYYFVDVFDIHVSVRVSLLNRMFAFMLHSDTPQVVLWQKSVIWHNFQSSSNKQAIQTFHCFVLSSYFIQPSECRYVLFVCLSVRLQVSFIPLRFRYFGLRFSFPTGDLPRKSPVVPPTLWFSRKRFEIIFGSVTDREN